jgi:hypothetical protein
MINTADMIDPMADGLKLKSRFSILVRLLVRPITPSPSWLAD